MKLPGFFSLEGHYNGLQLVLITIACLAVCAGLIFLISVHVVFLIIIIPGLIFAIIVFIISIMKWLSRSEEEERKLSSLWFWDKKEKQERAKEDGKSAYDDETQRRVEGMKRKDN